MQKARGHPLPRRAIGLPQIVGTWFQVLFTPLYGVLFTFPSRYWFAIGHQLVFSLGRWSSQLPTGFLVPRGTRVEHPGSVLVFAYGAVTLCGSPSQKIRLTRTFFTSRGRRSSLQCSPTTPHRKRLRAITPTWFGLFPVRSPLLRESRLISVPAGTEMFQFPALAPGRSRVTPHDRRRVSPFGHPRIIACLPAPRGLSQATTSFIASYCLGIHHVRLVT